MDISAASHEQAVLVLKNAADPIELLVVHKFEGTALHSTVCSLQSTLYSLQYCSVEHNDCDFDAIICYCIAIAYIRVFVRVLQMPIVIFSLHRIEQLYCTVYTNTNSYEVLDSCG